MSQEIRGNDEARSIKAIGAMMMIVGLVVAIGGGSTGSDMAMGVGTLLSLGGFFVFVWGRFMD